mmetsp:Transcript_28702/g.73680  ORF Transcript_28702/g.73680 Transcript_28702/m.73680 type:complete len:226 (+) Transcript_28702:642-1319(+)
MSPRIGLPLASVSELASSMMSWPAPSATQMTACPFLSMMLCTWAATLSMLNLVSGIRHRSTTPEAMDASMAMKPDWRPMSFTIPRPHLALEASTLAASRARWDSSTAVWYPKQRSISRMSLSIDLGTPTTAILSPRFSTSLWMALAAALPPLPPTTNTMLMPHRSRRSTMRGILAAPPREVPRMVPPRSWMPSTTRRVRWSGLVLWSYSPMRPLRMPKIWSSGTP